MAEYAIETEVAETDMPDLPVNRTGQWTDAVKAAAADGKVRITRGVPEDMLDKVRRQLSHTAGALRTEDYPDGAGVVTRVKDDNGKSVLYWQVTTKRERTKVDESGTSTPGNGAGAAATSGGSGPAPGKAAGAKKSAA